MAAQRSQALALMRTMLRASKSFKVRPAMPRASQRRSRRCAGRRCFHGRLGQARPRSGGTM